MTTGRKLVIGGVIVAGLTAYMAYRGASASWQYYLTADECLAESASLGRATACASAAGSPPAPSPWTMIGRGLPSPWKETGRA